MGSWPLGYGRRVLAQVDSTNAEAARVAPGLAGPEWILARAQSAGRGRRGRAWVMPEGNFAATLVLVSGVAPQTMALRSFVASLALHDALVAACGRAAAITLKWPNDVMLNDGKVAGILLEGLGTRLAIGIGVNLAQAPSLEEVEAGALRPVSLAEETGVCLEPEAFLERLAAAYAAREESFAAYGFGPTRAAWIARAARLGEQITARTARAEYRGRFDTVDEQGQLVLSTPEGRVRIAAADVFF
ncbi:biotin--[acetyl-CoA-carboxylase] ligase [Poseidonocella sedimentorum]|uniref:biotin--[biotin carboxyl-carrier protein] ligase n=1 Tax=Poseidonocella sedimentorum TaxID=871652 RepID=A0A1I6CNR6_9RHOB|nr:biotin--[acetyl-CoA-carboxylase] ligase [Poseidonocella sedimentorum]SFQ94807.1 BirA family transcriptional regulator, biotin operon repressor / biotin-[acetyl-CoA-carboxylase] ligase [Poseidonocella sedimentorum]